MPLVNNLHPLNDDLSKFSNAQLEQKLGELRSKYHKARNPHLKNQLNFFITDYQEELRSRLAKEANKLAKDQGKDLDNLINVD
jgi:hypothetical protein